MASATPSSELSEEELLDIDREVQIPNVSMTTYRREGAVFELMSFADTERARVDGRPASPTRPSPPARTSPLRRLSAARHAGAAAGLDAPRPGRARRQRGAVVVWAAPPHARRRRARRRGRAARRRRQAPDRHGRRDASALGVEVPEGLSWGCRGRPRQHRPRPPPTELGEQLEGAGALLVGPGLSTPRTPSA